MGLVKCPDCGKMFSDRIAACINCGCPIEIAKEASFRGTINEEKQEILDSDCPAVSKEELQSLTYAKSDLMSVAEVREFVINSICPYIVKELDLSNDEIMRAPEEDNADVYVKKNGEITGIRFQISVAPNKLDYIDSIEHFGPFESSFSREMLEKGYKCAYANVSLGASDTLRFDRRVVLKNDSYYFDYEKLYYPLVKANGVIDVIYTPGIDITEDELCKAVYSEEEDRKKPSDIGGFSLKGDKLVWEPGYSEPEKIIKPSSPEKFDKLVEVYNLQKYDSQNLADYLYTLYVAIEGDINEKDLTLTFFNCIDYCNGIFLSDSNKVPEDKIMPKCMDLITTNSLYFLSEHKKFVVAHYVYNYMINGYCIDKITMDEMHSKRISLFEYSPKLFGFKELKGEKEKKEEALDKAAKRKDVIEVKTPRFKDLCNQYDYLNKCGQNDITEYRLIYNEVKAIGEEIRSYFFDYFMDDQEVDVIRTAMFSLIFLLEKDIEILNKTLSGRYGFIEKRKDNKEREEKFNRYKSCIKKCNF